MSGKVFSRVRGGGFFKRADIVVYALIAVVAIVLLLVFLRSPMTARPCSPMTLTTA